MDFVNKNISGAFKIAIAAAVLILFITNLHWIILLGICVWAISKVVKYFRNWKSHNNLSRNNFSEEVGKNSTTYDEDYNFDLSEKKIIDVDYKEI